MNLEVIDIHINVLSDQICVVIENNLEVDILEKSDFSNISTRTIYKELPNKWKKILNSIIKEEKSILDEARSKFSDLIDNDTRMFSFVRDFNGYHIDICVGSCILDSVDDILDIIEDERYLEEF